MPGGRMLATAGRVLRQLAHDHRTVAIVVVIPLVVLTLLHYLFDQRQPVVSRIELIMLALFPMILMFLLTSIAMVRERISGTLERLMTTPVGKADVIFGYAGAFGLVAAVQVIVATTFAYTVLGLQVAGSVWMVLLTSIVGALLGVAFGLLASAVSTSEFQAVQLFPAVMIPQFLLCGLFGPREQMADVLRWLSDVMPVTYAVEALTELANHATLTTHYWVSLGVTVACVIALLGIAALTLRRRTP